MISVTCKWKSSLQTYQLTLQKPTFYFLCVAVNERFSLENCHVLFINRKTKTKLNNSHPIHDQMQILLRKVPLSRTKNLFQETLQRGDLTDEQHLLLFAQQEGQRARQIPPETYICHNCGQPGGINGHYIQKCPMERQRKRRRYTFKGIPKTMIPKQDERVESDDDESGVVLEERQINNNCPDLTLILPHS